VTTTTGQTKSNKHIRIQILLLLRYKYDKFIQNIQSRQQQLRLSFPDNGDDEDDDDKSESKTTSVYAIVNITDYNEDDNDDDGLHYELNQVDVSLSVELERPLHDVDFYSIITINKRKLRQIKIDE